MEASALHSPAHAPPKRPSSGRRSRVSLSGPLLRLRSDDQLVALFRAGDEEAFTVIHDRYRQRLLAYGRQMLPGSPQDAEDAMQDVFLRAYGALRTSSRPVTLRPWLYRIAHNRCIDQIRRPQLAVDVLADITRPPVQDPPAEAQQREDLRQLVRDVGALPDQQRSALLMRELEGLSYADTATALGVTLPAVKSLLVRARIGLVQASEARDTACVDIRHDLVGAHGRGVRATARARRHLRDCDGCREYRRELRSLKSRLAAIAPPVAAAGPIGLLAKLTGIGGGSGVTAAGGVASGGAVAGWATTAVTVTKVCAVVCSIAVTSAGAVEVGRQVTREAPAPAPAAHIAPAPATPPQPEVTAPVAAIVVAPVVAAPPVAKAPAPATAVAVEPSVDPAVTDDGGDSTGGLAAPAADEEAATPATEELPVPPPDATLPQEPPAAEPVAPAEPQDAWRTLEPGTASTGSAPPATPAETTQRAAAGQP